MLGEEEERRVVKRAVWARASAEARVPMWRVRGLVEELVTVGVWRLEEVSEVEGGSVVEGRAVADAG